MKTIANSRLARLAAFIALTIILAIIWMNILLAFNHSESDHDFSLRSFEEGDMSYSEKSRVIPAALFRETNSLQSKDETGAILNHSKHYSFYSSLECKGTPKEITFTAQGSHILLAEEAESRINNPLQHLTMQDIPDNPLLQELYMNYQSTIHKQATPTETAITISGKKALEPLYLVVGVSYSGQDLRDLGIAENPRSRDEHRAFLQEFYDADGFLTITATYSDGCEVAKTYSIKPYEFYNGNPRNYLLTEI